MAKEKGKISFKAWGVDFVDIPYMKGDYWEKQPERIYLGVAGTAAMVRQFLKALYPGVKFWVKSESYSMGNSINAYSWGFPENEEAARVIDRELSAKFQEGHFNSMEDIYEYGKMEEIKTDDGRTIDYGTKYMHYYTKPPYGSPEYNLPPPDYSKIGNTKKEVPRGTGSGKKWKKFEKKPDVIKDSGDYKLLVKLTTGWELFYKEEPSGDVEMVFKFNYSVGKAVYDKEKWSKLKSLLESTGLIWSLRLKGFFLSQDRGGVQSLVVNKQYAIEQLLDAASGIAWPYVDNLFAENGYKRVLDQAVVNYDVTDGKLQILSEGKIQPQPDPEPVPAPTPKLSGKEEIAQMIKSLYTLNKLSPSDEITKKIKALETLQKYS